LNLIHSTFSNNTNIDAAVLRASVTINLRKFKIGSVFELGQEYVQTLNHFYFKIMKILKSKTKIRLS